MIPFDFDYYRPENLNEAVTAFNECNNAGKVAVYYGGGTELISMARAGSIKYDAVIDIKNIPECTTFCFNNNDLVIGSAVTLTQIFESGFFPLLGETVARIADHTNQCKITIGGNLASTIIYREAAMPLMLTNSRLIIKNQNGLYEVPFMNIFDGRLHLQKGEFIVQILIDRHFINLPYNHVKKTKNEKIDYPLLSMTAIKDGNNILSAVSGLANSPMILPPNILNDKNNPVSNRIENIVTNIYSKIESDLSGSKEYKAFVLKNVLNQMYKNFNEV